MRGGAPWYELTHDRFIKPILDSNAKWRANVIGGRLLAQRFEELAKDWESGGRPADSLLSGGELRDAKRWLSDPDAEELSVSEAFRNLVAASEDFIAQRRTRNLRYQRALILLLLVAATGVAIYTYYAKSRIEDSSLRERGRIAKRLAAMPGRELDAVSLGVGA